MVPYWTSKDGRHAIYHGSARRAALNVPYTDVWTFPTVQAYPGKHPCEKPLAMMEHIINASTRADMLICDPFLGSASTMVAAVRNGRRSVGIEASREYCDKAARRLESVTQLSLLEAV